MDQKYLTMSDPNEKSPFDVIVDDSAAREQATEWARDELLAGRNADELTAELIEQGWDEDDARLMVEAERKDTRAERGVLTRDAVARGAEKAYRGAFSGGWVTGFPTIASARRLMHAIASMRWLKGLPRKPPE